MADNYFHIDKDSKEKKEFFQTPDEKKRREKALLNEEKETQEVLDAGQDSTKKAIKAIESQVGEEEKQKKSDADEVLNKLDMSRKFAQTYKRNLAQALSEILTQLDWIRGWTADCIVTNGSPIMIKGKAFETKKGILLVVCAPNGRVMHQGMLVTGEPILDYSGIITMALQVENTMDSERGLLMSNKKPEEGLVDKDGYKLRSK